MVTVAFDKIFEKRIKKIKDGELKNRVKKQIEKIVNNPEIGKDMSYSRKGTREIHIPPFRMSYKYEKKNDKIIFLDFYHKDKQ